MSKTINKDFIGKPYMKIKYERDTGMRLPLENKDGSKNPKATRKVLSHLKYIAHRSREQDRDKDTYGVFNEKSNHADIYKFYESIENDKALKHSNTVKIHKLTIGFSRNWYERYGIDFKNFTRHVISKLEERKGIKLEWVAAEHQKEESPHVHIVIKSVGEDDNGNSKRLNISKEDYQYLRDEIDLYTGREQFLNRDQQLEQDRGLMPDIIQELTKQIDKLNKQAEREGELAQRKAEQQRKRDDRER